MPTIKLSSKELRKRPSLLRWSLLPAFLLLALFAFSDYYRTDKYNTECSNTSDACMSYQMLYNKIKFGCSCPIIDYKMDYDTLRIGRNIERKIVMYGSRRNVPVKVIIVDKSDSSSLREERLNFQKYYQYYFMSGAGGFKDLTRINDSVYTSEIKFFKMANETEGPFVKTGKRDPVHGDLYRPKYDSIYYAVNYLYYKKWIYCILIPGMDTVALKKKVADMRNSFDFYETHLKEPTFSQGESTAIISALSLLLLACLLVGYRRVRSSLRSRKAKAVYFLRVLCLYALISVYLCLPNICFTSWMRGGLLCLLFTCLGIGILLSMFRKALHKR